MARNRIQIITVIDGEPVSHFSLDEFANANGWVMLDSSIPRSCELTRRELNAHSDRGEVQLIITDSTRTEAQNNSLAARLGWADMGGAVSRDSQHLEKHGGKAVDLYARYSATLERVPQKEVGIVARRYFDFVKDDYADGHVHCDNRDH